MPIKKYCSQLGNQEEPNQLSLGPEFTPTWQYQELNSNWKPGHLPQGNLLDLDLQNKTANGLEEYHYNTDNSWDSRDKMQTNLNTSSSGLIQSVQYKHSNMANYEMFNSNEVCLVLTVAPENRFRYRYDTEMSGTHGSLQGYRIGSEKSVPTVELLNYPYEALIRVTLVTCQGKEELYPHPHSLFVKEKLYQKKVYAGWDDKILTKTGHYSDPHYIRVGTAKNNYTARFEGMCIINSKKENFHSSVKEKLQLRLFEQKYGLYGDVSPSIDESEELAKKVEAAVSTIDVDFVCLCFEAFREENGKLFPICQPICSEPIGNAKSAKTGKLKISRINKCSGSCRGGDEIWLLVEKINKKGLVVRFSEEYNGRIIWQSCIEGDDLILHHQYAIIFKTPAYKDLGITSEVEVLMRLERTTQPNQPCDYSEPITFVYEPMKSKCNKGDNLCRKESILAPLKQIQIKRPRTDSTSNLACNYLSCRRTDSFEFDDNLDFEDSSGDVIDELLLDGKDCLELDQAWGKFNVEEFLRYISADDVDMPLQRDCAPSNTKFRRDFLYKLYLLYSKLDEGDMKKLTDQISNFRVSRKDISQNKSGNEKDQEKDAASTLLSLRSKAVNNNSVTSCSTKGDKNKKIKDATSQNKANLPNGINEPCASNVKVDPDVQTPPVHVGVIKSIFLKAKPSTEGPKTEDKTKHNPLLTGDSKSINEYRQSQVNSNKGISVILENKDKGKVIQPLKPFKLKDIKRGDTSIRQVDDNQETMNSICKLLNKSGSWKTLADVWKCSHAISLAKESSNPAKCILEVAEQIHGRLDLDVLRNLLDVMGEKKALELVDELIFAKKHL